MSFYKGDQLKFKEFLYKDTEVDKDITVCFIDLDSKEIEVVQFKPRNFNDYSFTVRDVRFGYDEYVIGITLNQIVNGKKDLYLMVSLLKAENLFCRIEEKQSEFNFQIKVGDKVRVKDKFGEVKVIVPCHGNEGRYTGYVIKLDITNEEILLNEKEFQFWLAKEQLT